VTERVLLHDAASVNRMRAAARLAREVLDAACGLAMAGVATDAVDAAVHDAIVSRGAYPSPLNYAGFPKSLCASVNEVVCHGIPDLRPLEDGDVVSFDVSCYLYFPDDRVGVHGDNCATVIVGDAQERDEIGRDWRGVPYRSDVGGDGARFDEARRLVAAAHEALHAGVAACGPGRCLSDIGAAIEDVSDREGYGSVRRYRGHGIGTDFHCAPFVRHYRNDDKLGASL
jgi:methionyl aminopeptidase